MSRMSFVASIDQKRRHAADRGAVGRDERELGLRIEADVIEELLAVVQVEEQHARLAARALAVRDGVLRDDHESRSRLPNRPLATRSLFAYGSIAMLSPPP